MQHDVLRFVWPTFDRLMNSVADAMLKACSRSIGSRASRSYTDAQGELCSQRGSPHIIEWRKRHRAVLFDGAATILRVRPREAAWSLDHANLPDRSEARRLHSCPRSNTRV